LKLFAHRIGLLVLIAIKLVLVTAMVSRHVSQFIYAGF
jgi:hypothetical protein